MENLSGYCKVVATMDKGNVHVHYHDNEYGFPIEDDNHLFARLILEINQAGLSWTTILTKEEWVKLFKKTFRFTGGEIVGEFLMSTGYLPGAHVEGCPVYKKVLKQKPAWAKKEKKK
jgi:3-methyladenine DNA glycosylase Tag